MHRIAAPRCADGIDSAPLPPAIASIVPQIISTSAIMKRTCLIALLLLAACVTAPGGLPRLHYADAASRGAFASFMAGRPNQAQVDRVTQNWSDALGDSFACGVRMRDVLNAGLAGALEIGAMTAAASAKCATASAAMSARSRQWRSRIGNGLRPIAVRRLPPGRRRQRRPGETPSRGRAATV